MDSRSRLRSKAAATLLATAGLVSSSLALATGVMAGDSDQIYPVSVNCDDPTKQLCTPIASVSVTTTGTLVVDFRTASTHCSAAIAHLLLDGTEVFVSPPLGPAVSTGPKDLGPVAAGEHVVGVQIEGVAGGCNAGGVGAWGGTLTITVSGEAAASEAAGTPTTPPAAPTPTPAPGAGGGVAATDNTPLIAGLAVLVLLIGGLFAYSYLRRGRLAMTTDTPTDAAGPTDPHTPSDAAGPTDPYLGTDSISPTDQFGPTDPHIASDPLGPTDPYSPA